MSKLTPRELDILETAYKRQFEKIFQILVMADDGEERFKAALARLNSAYDAARRILEENA